MALSRARLVVLVALICVGLNSGNAVYGQDTDEAPLASDTVAASEVVADGAADLAEADVELTPFDEFVAKVRKGGVIVVILAVLSVMMLATALERLVNLRRRRVVPAGLMEESLSLWTDGNFAELGVRCRASKSVLGEAIEVIVEHRENEVDQVQRLAEELAGRELKLQLRRAYPLAIVATTAPLLGLLGTVFGMIGAFDTVAQAGALGDPSLLADDISKALVTTAAGLVVAIPSLALYHHFKSKTSYLGVLIEEEITALTCAWFMKRATPLAEAVAGKED